MDNDRYRRLHLPRRIGSRRRKLRKSSADIGSALSYMKDPTGKGLWKLRANWVSNEGVTKFIEESTLRRFKKKSEDEAEDVLNSELRRIHYALSEIEDIGFLLRLFLFLHHKNKSSENEGVHPQYSPAEDYNTRHLFINYDGIEKKFQPALDFFSKKIFHGEFSGYAGRRYSGIKSGNFVVIEKDEEESSRTKSKTYIEISSVTEQPLKDLAHFLELLGKITDKQIYTVFSPEDELLSPYVEIVSSMLDSINLSDELTQQFEKMVADYESENFTGCVATAGLVAEETLIQIYETVARRPCPPRQTLGDLSSKIGLLSKELLNPSGASKTPLNRKEVMKNIRNIESDDIANRLSFSINAALEYVDLKYKEKFLEVDSKSGDYDYRLFPQNIKINLDNLISYRNNSLHKSTVIIGSLEALKSVQASLCLVMWWDEEKKKIRATSTPKEVLESLIEASN